jgi:hypothetical protein
MVLDSLSLSWAGPPCLGDPSIGSQRAVPAELALQELCQGAIYGGKRLEILLVGDGEEAEILSPVRWMPAFDIGSIL